MNQSLRINPIFHLIRQISMVLLFHSPSFGWECLIWCKSFVFWIAWGQFILQPPFIMIFGIITCVYSFLFHLWVESVLELLLSHSSLLRCIVIDSIRWQFKWIYVYFGFASEFKRKFIIERWFQLFHIFSTIILLRRVYKWLRIWNV